MSNHSGKAYGLMVLCPLKSETGLDQSPEAFLRDFLNDLPQLEQSPMAAVPNTYLCRFFVLNDVFYQGKPAELDHLKSKYLAFVAEIHAPEESDVDEYLRMMWRNAGGGSFVPRAWKYCLGFETVTNADQFAEYMRRCQIHTTLYFNGSTDEPLSEQLKALYLKQEFTRFVYQNQGLPAPALQEAFRAFVARVRPSAATPTWRPGASSLATAVIE
jgi:hypothetical protein